MFTIKVFGLGGHTVCECEQYRFCLGDVGADGFLTTTDHIIFGEDHVISVGADTIYIMNSNGKTVDTYHPYSPDDPRRWAVDPDCARRLALQGNESAQKYVSRIGAAPVVPEKEAPRRVEGVQPDQIMHMVARFLNWKLPENFRPDAGISFQPEFNVEYNAKHGQPPQRHEPSGTNLFDGEQAEKMVRHMVEGMPQS